MAELVGAFGVPHMPNTPLAVRQSPTGELGQLFGAVRDQVDAVPFWVNGIAPPLPLAGRVYAAGQMVRQAIAALPVHLRVGIIASGALSGDIGGTHALPGGPGGPPDEEWVRFAIDWSLRRCGVLRTGGTTGGGFG